MVQKIDWVQMRESGFSSHYIFVLGAEAKAKTVTSFLIILSVLEVSCAMQELSRG